MPISQTIKTSELVRELRSRLGLTHEQFAGKLGVTFVSVNRWENGKTHPSPVAQKLLEALLVQIGESIQGLHSQERQVVDLLAKPFKNEG
ncbi:helix-turn-helix transcriptional regulator [Tumidithrix elongata RA019]|uniref:Helix-turn-helix transcriptional regulator n=1 Tax=Tumidithrix elongata BACA0141 TaxID=2716417 RepID=A0AAW9PTV6_9CYAN|nr:helix-turn-helix transcriptional regulator [Tumidithrix elongata RA019]